MTALLRSFRYAFRGLYRATRNERNLRIHLVIALYMYGFLLLTDWFVVTPVQWALLLLTSALVIAAELFNTAIEATVNLATQGRHHRLAAAAKDAAAAGVLVCALFAVAVGVVILGQPEAFRRMGDYFGAHPVILGVVAISVGFAGAFIFWSRPTSDGEKTGPTAGAPSASISTGTPGSTNSLT